MSHSACGAAKPNVNAVTPPLTNCRRVKCIAASVELILTGTDDQARESGNLLLQLRVAAGPRRAGAQVVAHRRSGIAVEADVLEARQHVLEHAVGAAAIGLRIARQVETLVL